MRQAETEEEAGPSWGVSSVVVRGHNHLTWQASHMLINLARSYVRYGDMIEE
jgi:hypothetical protein